MLIWWFNHHLVALESGFGRETSFFEDLARPFLLSCAHGGGSMAPKNGAKCAPGHVLYMSTTLCRATSHVVAQEITDGDGLSIFREKSITDPRRCSLAPLVVAQEVPIWAQIEDQMPGYIYIVHEHLVTSSGGAREQFSK